MKPSLERADQMIVATKANSDTFKTKINVAVVDAGVSGSTVENDHIVAMGGAEALPRS